MASKEKEIPEKFLGKFKLERSEMFDEYLASKGVSWLLRKLICFSSVTKTFEKAATTGKYNAYNQSSKVNTSWEGWALGESFEGAGLDGKQHKISFDLIDNGETLTEQHFRLDNPQDPGELYRYTVEDDQLVLSLSNESVSARRFFKRIH